jgi:hypothetical protein
MAVFSMGSASVPGSRPVITSCDMTGSDGAVIGSWLVYEALEEGIPREGLHVVGIMGMTRSMLRAPSGPSGFGHLGKCRHGAVRRASRILRPSTTTQEARRGRTAARRACHEDEGCHPWFLDWDGASGPCR